MAPPLVLVVEDEFLVRMNALSLLEEAGFGVLEAGSADEAIALLEVEQTSGSSLPTSTCLEAWTDYDLRTPSGTVGHQSSLCLRLA